MVQIAICAVLVTSSLVAVRGLRAPCAATSDSSLETPCWSDTDLAWLDTAGPGARHAEANDRRAGHDSRRGAGGVGQYYPPLALAPEARAIVFNERDHGSEAGECGGHAIPSTGFSRDTSRRRAPPPGGQELHLARRQRFRPCRGGKPRVCSPGCLGRPIALGRYYKMKDGTRVQVVALSRMGNIWQPDRRTAAGHVFARARNRR